MLAKGGGRRREKLGLRREIFGGERMYAGKKAGRRRRVRRGLEIDLGGLGYTFPFLNDMLYLLSQKAKAVPGLSEP